MVHGESGSWRPGGASAGITVTLLVLCGPFLSLVPNACGAHQPARARISFESEAYVAGFDGPGPATVQANGTVSVKKDPSSRGVARLEALIDTGWTVMVSPSTLVATEADQKFTVTVIVPQGTLTNGSVMLRIFCSYLNSALASDSAEITAGLSPGVRVVLERPIQQAGDGRPPSFTAVVTNTGNAVDTIRCGFGIETWNHYSARRWYAVDRSFLQDMAPGESRKVSYTGHYTGGGFRQPEIITFSFPFYTKSPQNQSWVEWDIVVLTIHTEPDYLSWLDAPATAVILWAAAICAIAASMGRQRKRRKGPRAPCPKEVASNESE